MQPILVHKIQYKIKENFNILRSIAARIGNNAGHLGRNVQISLLFLILKRNSGCQQEV
jgi:hypothetical protein